MGLFGIFKKKNETPPEQKRSAAAPSLPITISVEHSQEEVIPIEKRIKGANRSCDGLYPHEILVLSYASKFCDGQNDFQGFWWYKYGIRDMQSILTSLAKQGYIERGTIADAINMEKVPVIKEELQKRNLKFSGKKADLIARLIENVAEGELSTVFSKRPYALTEAGMALLKKYEWIPYIHNHEIEDLNIWNLTDLVQTPPYTNYRDKIWGYLNKRGLEHIKNRNYGLYRNSRFTMSEFVVDEGKLETAFTLLCEVAAYDLSGLSNGFRMEFLDICSKSYFPYEESVVTMAPGITSRIEKYAKELEWEDAELHSRMVNEIGKLQLPFHLFSAEECADIVIAEIHEDKTLLNRIYSVVEVRFKKRYKSK